MFYDLKILVLFLKSILHDYSLAFPLKISMLSSLLFDFIEIQII